MAFHTCARVILLAIAFIVVTMESAIATPLPFVGEIRIFAGQFEPAGWYLCDGRLLPISEFELLYSIIGTTYGGDGQSTFALPDLRGRAPMHYDSLGTEYKPGDKGGVETVTLNGNNVPSHTHSLNGYSGFATQTSPANGVFAVPFLVTNYCPANVARQQAAASTLYPIGGNQPHSNMQPYLVVNYIIAVMGNFPSAS